MIIAKKYKKNNIENQETKSFSRDIKNSDSLLIKDKFSKNIYQYIFTSLNSFNYDFKYLLDNNKFQDKICLQNLFDNFQILIKNFKDFCFESDKKMIILNWEINSLNKDILNLKEDKIICYNEKKYKLNQNEYINLIEINTKYKLYLQKLDKIINNNKDIISTKEMEFQEKIKIINLKNNDLTQECIQLNKKIKDMLKQSDTNKIKDNKIILLKSIIDGLAKDNNQLVIENNSLVEQINKLCSIDKVISKSKIRYFNTKEYLSKFDK